MQDSLFEEHADETFDLDGAKLRVIRSWLDTEKAKEAFSNIQEKTHWQNPKIKMAGQWITIPRLQAWYGTDALKFTYSNFSFISEPMFDDLIHLQQTLESEFKKTFNSVLVNCYRDASDSVSWHADDEAEFGFEPTIASLSLGESRRFCLKPKKSVLNKAQKSGSTNNTLLSSSQNLELLLHSGDLLVMSGATQSNWLHCVPKESFPCKPRINLTFRKIVESPFIKRS